jgi:signal transduction histidine kinase
MITAVVILAVLAAAACGCSGWLWWRLKRASHAPIDRPNTPRRIAPGELLDAFPDPFFVVDGAGVITLANAAAAAVFGPPPPVGRLVVETLGDARLAAPYQECRDNGKAVARHVLLPPEAAPNRAAATTGDSLWLADAAPLPGGSPDRVRLLLRDLSAGHRLEQIRKDFVANASHELRTPITLVGGYLETFIETPEMLDDRPTALRYLKIMRKHTDRIARIIEDMLLLSRIEAGNGAGLKMKEFPLQECVQDIVERLESLIRERGAEVRIALHDPAAKLHGDRFYWTQVFFNLIENSLKQNPRPGLVVTVRSVELDHLLRLEVEDNGIGIPAADLPFIFNRFYRVEKHHSQNEIKGTGLGLSIVKRAVEAHGGTIICESAPGIRTVFRMDMPR